MRYKKTIEFQTAPDNLRTAYDAKMPVFDRAEILESENGDAVLRCYVSDKTFHYRIESDGSGGWVFFGGILLLSRQS